MRAHSLPKTVCIVFVFCAATTIISAQTLTTLHTFDGTDGSSPGGLVQATNGNFYGTTSGGGTSGNCRPYGCGTIFEITPGGKLTTLHSFDNTDGSIPNGLVQATNGNFYGTTLSGGELACDGGSGCGTVFEITPGGELTTLHSFDFTDGSSPGTLLQATNGNFYGTTAGGGTSGSCGVSGCGTVFEITPAGKLTILHSFDGTAGSSPGGLVQATNGNFYGTTASSVNCGVSGCGTVFEITPAGELTTLHNFENTDGIGLNGLVQATNGNFYGTTGGGGPFGYGTVFEITPAGKLTTLHSFDNTDGNLANGLVQATNGNFYGTTASGGELTCGVGSGCGTVFEITPTGKLTTLHSFDNTDGKFPNGLVQATNGNFYGTTAAGGTSGNCPYHCGTVFRLSVGLGPFVETRPTAGKVGTKVIILGNNLTGSTSVTFNGASATFTVVSSSEITATVPDGATTGKVKVKTPSGMLTSNVNFGVAPTISSFSPTSGPVGTRVAITGESFTEATSVSFGGVKATSFTVNCEDQITVTVPTGAKTGKISVTTPGGTATSANNFTVG